MTRNAPDVEMLLPKCTHPKKLKLPLGTGELIEMAEYIEREAAINLLLYKWDESCSSAVGDFEDIPAADVAPVVHGRNITKQHPVDEFICSECGLITRDNNRYVIEDDSGEESCYEFTVRYCPLCGAKVEKEP